MIKAIVTLWIIAACICLASFMAYESFTQMQGIVQMLVWGIVLVPICLIVAIVTPWAYIDIMYGQS